MFSQYGSGKCVICGSEGTNKSTCPCNPAVTKPNFEKHYKWKEVCPQVKPGKILPTVKKVSPPKKFPSPPVPKPTLITLWDGKENLNEVHKFMGALNTLSPKMDNLRAVRYYLEDHGLPSKLELSKDDKKLLSKLIYREYDIFRKYDKLAYFKFEGDTQQLYDELNNFYPTLHQIFKDFTKWWGRFSGEEPPFIPLADYKMFNFKLKEIFNILSKYPALKKKEKVTGCVKMETKKYMKRSSPPYPANQCCGQTMKGNDGNMYESRPDKNNVCRWYLVRKPEPVKKAPIPKKLPSPKLPKTFMDLTRLPYPVIANMIEQRSLTATDLTHLMETDPKVKAYLEKGDIGQLVARTIKKVKERRILPAGNQVLMDMGLTVGDETSLDDITVISKEYEDYYEEHGDYPMFMDLPLGKRNEMLNTLLSPASEILVEMPVSTEEDIYKPVRASSPHGITVQDFLNVWFENNRKWKQDVPEGVGLFFEGISKTGKYDHVKGKFIPDDDDDKFRIHFGT